MTEQEMVVKLKALREKHKTNISNLKEQILQLEKQISYNQGYADALSSTLIEEFEVNKPTQELN